LDRRFESYPGKAFLCAGRGSRTVYLYVNMQLPNAASLERTSAAAKQVEELLANTPGVQYTTSVIGFSLLSYVRTSYNAFFWVSLKPWDERGSRSEQYQAIRARLDPELKKLPAGTVFSFSHRRYRESALLVALPLSLRTAPARMSTFLPTT
jgi:multidrug efflux pump subunit AcrB